MAFADSGGGGGSVGSTLGSLASKAAQTVVGSKPKSTTTKPKTTKPKSTGGGGSSKGGSKGGSSGGYSGGSSKGGSSGGAAPASNPSVPNINAYLGTDSIYQNTLRGSKLTLADYLSELARRKGEATTQFNDTKAGMERDRVQQLEDLKNEYASRGLINSGLYADEQGKFQQDYMTQLDALTKQQTALLADLVTQQTNFQREQELANERAKQEALQRRSAKYNIGG